MPAERPNSSQLENRPFWSCLPAARFLQGALECKLLQLAEMEISLLPTRCHLYFSPQKWGFGREGGSRMLAGVRFCVRAQTHLFPLWIWGRACTGRGLPSEPADSEGKWEAETHLRHKGTDGNGPGCGAEAVAPPQG